VADEHVAAAGQQGAHVGTARVPPLLEGLTIGQVGGRFEGDLMGDDASAWPGLLASSIEEAHAAVAQPGALDRTVHLSFGDTSGQEYVVQLTADLAIHAWDLARVTGQDDTLDFGAAALLLPWAEPSWPRARRKPASRLTTTSAAGSGGSHRSPSPARCRPSTRRHAMRYRTAVRAPL
jgi:uncharacterized protein (TIGR03086 family)